MFCGNSDSGSRREEKNHLRTLYLTLSIWELGPFKHFKTLINLIHESILIYFLGVRSLKSS